MRRFAKIKFNNYGREYTYICDDKTIKPDDFVVVGTVHNASVGKVIGFTEDPKETVQAFTFVVQKVDAEALASATVNREKALKKRAKENSANE